MLKKNIVEIMWNIYTVPWFVNKRQERHKAQIILVLQQNWFLAKKTYPSNCVPQVVQLARKKPLELEIRKNELLAIQIHLHNIYLPHSFRRTKNERKETTEDEVSSKLQLRRLMVDKKSSKVIKPQVALRFTLR